MTRRFNLPPDATCCCGDVLDEHRDGRECTVEGCDCIHFELNPDSCNPEDDDE
jgi:hypothetical protein